jgi:pimeloyl-ACP methyl ester carboxylesterase
MPVDEEGFMRSATRGPRGWQIATLAAAGGLGAVIVARRLSEARAGEPFSVLEGEQGRFAWTYGDIFYTVRGRGEPVVMVHGVYPGASSFEYRQIFLRLAERFRVYAFDLLGFGLSDRPAVLYTPDLYVDLVMDFIRQVVGGVDHSVRVIASGLGAAFTVRAAAVRPHLFARLALIEPTGIEDFAGNPQEGVHLTQRWLLRAPGAGQSFYGVLTSRASLRYFLRRMYGKGADISDDVVDYVALMARQPGGRFAPASLLSGTLDTPIREEYEGLRMPILLLWGKNATFTPLEHARAFRQLNPSADLRVFDSGSFPHDQVPAEFVREVMSWLEAVRPSASR